MMVSRSPALWPILLMTLVGVIPQNGVKAWDTNWDAAFTYQCPRNKGLYRLHSVHSNRREDRRWTFSCRGVHTETSPQNCSWTGYVNAWDGVLNFECPTDHIITGINSYHCNRREDRRFKFKCCRHSGFVTNSCQWTPYLNRWDRPLNYIVPVGKALCGAYSVHNNHREDRRWKFRACHYFLN